MPSGLTEGLLGLKCIADLKALRMFSVSRLSTEFLLSRSPTECLMWLKDLQRASRSKIPHWCYPYLRDLPKALYKFMGIKYKYLMKAFLLKKDCRTKNLKIYD